MTDFQDKLAISSNFSAIVNVVVINSLNDISKERSTLIANEHYKCSKLQTAVWPVEYTTVRLAAP
jgi:uncharacterized protein YtpQ (UPF0354 family)